MPQTPLPPKPAQKKYLLIEADVKLVEEALMVAEALSTDSSWNYTISLNHTGKLTVTRVSETEFVEYLKLDL